MDQHIANSSRSTSLSVGEIMERIPHRYPFLLIDKVIDWQPYDSIVACKNVSFNEPFFQGHFPGKPVMPGVLIIEAMAQAACILSYLSEGKTSQDYLLYLAGVENARFKQMVVPGDILTIHVDVTARKNKFFKVRAQALTQDQIVCQADLMSAKG